MDKELLAEALSTLEKLTKHGQFFNSAIELSHWVDDNDEEMDGEEYEIEVKVLIAKIKDALKQGA